MVLTPRSDNKMIVKINLIVKVISLSDDYDFVSKANFLHGQKNNSRCFMTCDEKLQVYRKQFW